MEAQVVIHFSMLSCYFVNERKNYAFVMHVCVSPNSI